MSSVFLKRLHGDMIGSSTINQLRLKIYCLAADYCYNDSYDSIIQKYLNVPVIAGKCSILPNNYFKQK